MEQRLITESMELIKQVIKAEGINNVDTKKLLRDALRKLDTALTMVENKNSKRIKL